MSSILLVVPDTKYSQSVPVVIGTNVLDRMLSKVEEVHGAQYHQRVCLPDAWSMAFRTLKIQSRAVARGKCCLAIVKCAARKNVVIPGNTSMIIQCKIDHRVFSSASLCVAEQLAGSSLPEGMTITPVLMNVGADYSPVTIEVANLSSRPIVIEPSRTMCQIQSCAVETDLPADLPVGELNAALQKIDLNQSRLSEAEKQDVTKILSDWTDIFSANDLDVGLTSAGFQSCQRSRVEAVTQEVCVVPRPVQVCWPRSLRAWRCDRPSEDRQDPELADPTECQAVEDVCRLCWVLSTVCEDFFKGKQTSYTSVAATSPR